MKRKKVPTAAQILVERFRAFEQKLYADQLHDDRSMMKSGDRRFWHFRPSHHVASGLLTQEDVMCLSPSGKRLLSVGASPAFLEKLLPEIGVPAENIVLADKDPIRIENAGPLKVVTFDMNDPWPEMGTFDRIIFPESLCIAIGDRLKERGTAAPSSDAHPNDPLEAELLTSIMREALRRLRPGGIIRANGPMSHPKVVQKMEEALSRDGIRCDVQYKRYLMDIRIS